MTKPALFRLAPLLLAVPLLLVGCTAEAPVADSASDPSAAGASPPPAAEQPSPLDPHLDLLYARVSDEQFEADFLRAEEAVASCMADEGFDYNPRSASYLEADRLLQQPQLSSRDWVAENGYGFNAPKDEEHAALDAADPNVAIVAAMSTAELEAYYSAYWGDVNSGGTDEGCLGTTVTDIAPPLSLSDRWQPLVESLQQMYGQLLPADPVWQQINRDWSDCMAVAGHSDFDTPQDAQSSVESPDGVANAAALEREIDVALADIDCRSEVGYDARMRQVTVAAETVFFEQNRAQLDALLAESEQGE